MVTKKTLGCLEAYSRNLFRPSARLRGALVVGVRVRAPGGAGKRAQLAAQHGRAPSSPQPAPQCSLTWGRR